MIYCSAVIVDFMRSAGMIVVIHLLHDMMDTHLFHFLLHLYTHTEIFDVK